MAEEREFSAMGAEDGGEVMVDLVDGGVDFEEVGWVSGGVELFSLLFLSLFRSFVFCYPRFRKS